jgi:predicted nuclease of predicted toxin-antitoxin system
VKLLLDEMISPRVARELRDAGHDVQAVKHDRADLTSRSDREIVRLMAAEQRAIVTNDVADFQRLHDQFLAAGEAHHGMIFTFDATLPRSKAAIPLWIEALSGLLAEHGDNDSLRNRVHHLAV